MYTFRQNYCIKYLFISLILFSTLLGCNIGTYSGEFSSNISDICFLPGWEEIKSSVPALQQGEVLLVHLYNNFTIDQSGRLLSFSFDIFVDEYKNGHNYKVYNVNINNDSFSVSSRGKEQSDNDKIPVTKIMTTLDQLTLSHIVKMIPAAGDEYFIPSQIIFPGELVSRQYIDFDMASYEVSDSVVNELEDPFITDNGGIILHFIPINQVGEKSEYGQIVMYLFLHFPNS